MWPGEARARFSILGFALRVFFGIWEFFGISSTHFGKLSAIIFSNISSDPFLSLSLSLSLSSSLDGLMLSRNTWMACSVFLTLLVFVLRFKESDPN